MCVCGTRNIKGVYCGTPRQRAWWERCAVHTRTTLEYSFGVCVFIGMASPIRIYIYMHIHIHVHGMNESHTHRCGEREKATPSWPILEKRPLNDSKRTARRPISGPSPARFSIAYYIYIAYTSRARAQDGKRRKKKDGMKGATKTRVSSYSSCCCRSRPVILLRAFLRDTLFHAISL